MSTASYHNQKTESIPTHNRYALNGAQEGRMLALWGWGGYRHQKVAAGQVVLTVGRFSFSDG